MYTSFLLCFISLQNVVLSRFYPPFSFACLRKVPPSLFGCVGVVLLALLAVLGVTVEASFLRVEPVLLRRGDATAGEEEDEDSLASLCRRSLLPPSRGFSSFFSLLLASLCELLLLPFSDRLVVGADSGSVFLRGLSSFLSLLLASFCELLLDARSPSPVCFFLVSTLLLLSVLWVDVF